MSKRNEFIKRKNLKENLKKYNAFSMYGYYPLFSDLETAKTVSPLTSYHIHEFEDVEYYMPEGLEMGVTQFHGNYDGQIKSENLLNESIECYEALEETKESTSESSSWGPEHQWCVCAVWTDSTHRAYQNNTATGHYPVKSCDDNFSQWWPRAFAHPGNPLNPSYASNYDAFYHYAVSQVGPINVGDQVVFDTQQFGYATCSMLGIYGITKICFQLINDGSARCWKSSLLF